MTRPRQILPNIRFITRGCVGRQHFLHGGPEVNEIYEYLLALGCERFGLGLVAYVAMSNHTHVVLNDPGGRVTEWTEWMHALVARAVNSHLGRRGTFWEAVEQANLPELAEPAAVLEKAAYTLANPTLSGLVAESGDWIGARARLEDFERPREVRRPRLRFFEEGKLPEVVMLRLEVPPSHAHLTAAEFAAELGSAVAGLEAVKQAEMVAKGKRFLGRKRLAAMSWQRRAVSERKGGAGPAVLAQCAKLRRAVLDRIAQFRVDHELARLAFVGGDHAVLFPAGTDWMVRRMGATRHPPP